MKSFLTIRDCTVDQLTELLAISHDLKKLYKNGGRDLCLTGKVLAMLFEKTSLRTRFRFFCVSRLYLDFFSCTMITIHVIFASINHTFNTIVGFIHFSY